MKSTSEQLRDRGYIEDADLSLYLCYDKNELVKLLHSKTPWERTIASKLLSKHKDNETLDALVRCIAEEKKLYTKISLTESIACFGKMACAKLIPLLGKIGSNQHKMLPAKPFNKSSYPLPRDIIARTICKIGTTALEPLCDYMKLGDYNGILEAIDAIGFISYYHNDYSSLDAIIALHKRYKDDDLMTWKTLRALQSFPQVESINILNQYIASPVIQHQWEVTRSLEQIKKRA